MTQIELLTPKECAAYRRCSVRKLDRERAEGRGCPYVRIDDRIFYRRIDVDRFISAHIFGGDLGLPGYQIEPEGLRDLIETKKPAFSEGAADYLWIFNQHGYCGDIF